MTKKTQSVPIYPMNLGLDLSSIPGTQDPRALTVSKNNVIRMRPSQRKSPGITRLDYAGSDSGVQAAIQFFATSGVGQIDEIVRVRKGIVEALRGDQFVELMKDDGVGNLSEFRVSSTDTITFNRYQNVLIIHFENTPPVFYIIRGNLVDLTILSSHDDSPPAFSATHLGRLWYGGRPEDPHTWSVSVPGNPFAFDLGSGGQAISVRAGDGDPVGLTGGISFRGDFYSYKYNSIHRIVQAGNLFGIQDVTNEVGCVTHRTIIATQNDVLSVSSMGLNSLSMTDKNGAAELAVLTFPIYDFFQEDVNWSASKNMIATYDRLTNTYLLSYASSGSSSNDKVLGFNVVNKQFFTWEDRQYPVIGTYFDFGRKQTSFVMSEDEGIGILDDKVCTIFGEAIDFRVDTGIIFPLQNPKNVVTLTRGWLIAKPTTKSVEVKVKYIIDNREIETLTLNTFGDGDGSLINEDTGGLIGVDDIGFMPEDMTIIPFEMRGKGHSVKFSITQTPPDTDKDQPCEIYGLIFEYDFNEDDGEQTTI